MARQRLDGKVVLITGGAQGIGADTAARLVQRGAHVALVDRDADLVREHAATLGPNAAAFVADVTDAASVTAAVADAVAHFGVLDVAVA